jgi:hypothetical protein
MTISDRLCRWSIVAAILFGIPAGAQEPCGPAPDSYRSLPFGDVRFATEEGCARTFTHADELFIAGIAQTSLTKCGLPRQQDRRAVIKPFVKAAALAVASRADLEAAFATGTSMMEAIPCNGPEAALLARGIALYLKRTSRTSRFVAGCVEFYAGQYDATQCRCVAEKLKTIVPAIDQRFFDKRIIKDSIHRSPFVVFPLMVSCGMGRY